MWDKGLGRNYPNARITRGESTRLVHAGEDVAQYYAQNEIGIAFAVLLAAAFERCNSNRVNHNCDARVSGETGGSGS